MGVTTRMSRGYHGVNGTVLATRVVKTIIKKIVYGVILGLIYYIVYLQVLPLLLARITQTPITIPLGKMVVYLGFFLALGIAESVLRNHPISIPIKILSKVFGALILFVVLNGGILEGTIPLGSLTVDVRIDISPLLYIVILVSLIYGFIDAFSYLTSSEV